MMKYLKPADILFAFISALLIFFSVAELKNNGTSNPKAVIKVKESEYVYSLASKQTLVFKGEIGDAVIVLENGEAYFKESPCRDKICIHMGKVKKSGDFAACLPNRIILTAEGGKDEE